MACLEVRNLSIAYRRGGRPVRAVEDASFDIERGQFFGLVGESGCGKSTMAKAILRLLPASARASGQIRLDGRDLLALPEREMQRVRWKEVAYIPQ